MILFYFVKICLIIVLCRLVLRFLRLLFFLVFLAIFLVHLLASSLVYFEVLHLQAHANFFQICLIPISSLDHFQILKEEILLVLVIVSRFQLLEILLFLYLLLSLCIEGAFALSFTPYLEPCFTISGSSSINSSIDGLTIP